MVSSVFGNYFGSSGASQEVDETKENGQGVKNGGKDSTISKASSWADFFFKEFPVPIREFKQLIKDLGPICDALGITTKVDTLLEVISDLNNVYTSFKDVAKHGYSVWIEEIGSVNFKYGLLSVVSKVLYLAICVFGVTAVAGGAVGSAVIIATLFNLLIATHFYKKLVVDKEQSSKAENS